MKKLILLFFAMAILSFVPVQEVDGQEVPQGEIYLPYISVAQQGSEPVATATQTPTASQTATPTVTPTNTGENTSTPTSTATTIPTETPTASATSTQTSTPTSTVTSTETATATPTSTSTSTATQTPTPTSTPGKVLIVGRVLLLTRASGLVYIGEVQNQSSYPVSLTKISVTGYDANGSIMFVEDGYTRRYEISPWERACFEVYVDGRYIAPNSTGFISSWYVNIGSSLALNARNVSIDLTVPSIPQVLGEIENSNSQTANLPRAIVTLYDSFGNVISCGANYGVLQTLLPGESTPFKVTLLANTTIGGYAIFAEGDK